MLLILLAGLNMGASSTAAETPKPLTGVTWNTLTLALTWDSAPVSLTWDLASPTITHSGMGE